MLSKGGAGDVDGGTVGVASSTRRCAVFKASDDVVVVVTSVGAAPGILALDVGDASRKHNGEQYEKSQTNGEHERETTTTRHGKVTLSQKTNTPLASYWFLS